MVCDNHDELLVQLGEINRILDRLDGNLESNILLLKSFEKNLRQDGTSDVIRELLSKLICREEMLSGIIRQNESLARENREKDNFIAILAHDLRSPFNGFLGLTYLLSDEYQNLTSEDVHEISRTLNRSAKNIYSLLENLLEWSRIQRGMITFLPESIRFNKLVMNALETLLDLAVKKNILVAHNFHNDLVCFADRHMVETIIRNLVANSIKFTRNGGQINIMAEKRDDGFFQVIIKDNGTGISNEILSKLFNINEMVKRQGTESEPGSGLGLIICREFIRIHQGRIWIDTEPGKGTTVNFILPEK